MKIAVICAVAVALLGGCSGGAGTAGSAGFLAGSTAPVSRDAIEDVLLRSVALSL
jgi:hypothetical protein